MSDSPQTSKTLFELAEEEEARFVARLIGKMKRHNPVRQLANTYQSGDGLSEESFFRLLQGLQTPQNHLWKERIVSAWILSHASLQPEQSQAVATACENLLHGSRADYRIRGLHTFLNSCCYSFFASIGLFFVSTFVNVAFSMTQQEQQAQRVATWLLIFSGISMAYTILGFSFLPVLLPSLQFVADSRFNCLRTSAALAMGRLRLPSSIRALASVAGGPRANLASRSPRVRHAAIATLPRMLPLLEPYQFGLLGSEFVPNLCRLLDHPSEAVRQSVLEALEKVGDGRAIGPVEQRLKREQTPHIHETAERILPILRERLRAAQDPQVLLRPTSQPATQADQLLRPITHDNQAIDPETLLRASVQNTPPASP